MANNNNNNIVVNITGNSQGLTTAVNQAQTSLGNLRSAAQGNLQSITSSMAGMTTGMKVGFAGATVVLAAFSFALTSVAQAHEQAMELVAASAKSGNSVEVLQQQANMLRQTGLTLDNIADQNKDLKDKLGDALANNGGSMLTDVIQPLKLNILELKTLADAGEDVYAKIYFAAKAQGLSNTEITNLMETIGNDAVSRVQVYEKYASQQDYLNEQGRQTVSLTTEQVEKFKEYDAQSAQLAKTWESWKNSIASGLVPALTKVLELLNGITQARTSEDFKKMYNGSETVYTAAGYEDKAATGALRAALKLQRDILAIQKDQTKEVKKQDEVSVSRRTIQNSMQPLYTKEDQANQKLANLTQRYNDTKNAIMKSNDEAYKSNPALRQKDLSDLERMYKQQRQEQLDIINDKAGKDKASKAAESAATKQAALDKKNADARKKAQLDLSTALSKIGETEMQRQLNAFDFQQKEMQRKIAENAKLLGKSQAEIDKYLAQAKEQGARQRTELINKQIGYQDPNQGLKDLNANLNGVTLNDQQKNYLGQQQAQRVYGDNPFAVDNTQSKQQQLEDQYNQERVLNERLYAGTEEYEKRKAALQAKYAQDSMNTATENTRAQLTLLGNAAGDIGGMMAGAFGEQSAAAKAAFAVQKGLIISETIMRIQAALASALATPFPASLGAYAQIAGMGMQIISTIKGASSGQFHGGVDELPSHLNNKSFVLQQGERVVQAPANQKLTKFLDKQDQSSGNTSTGEITVNAPLIVQGGVNDDKMFNEYLKRHANNVNQAVRSAQSRNA
ncbi:hypothetical protein [Serratia marcescens]|uniref:hypothetical protein n=1 Tax=Serratia marcescens TaxID=615 RepID=UPI003988CA21